MKRFSFFMLIISVLFLFQSINTAIAQNNQSIAAVVNDDIVSIYDLQARVDLIIVFANLEITPQNRQRFAPQVLRKLIDEKLKRNYTNNFKIKVNRAALKRVIKTFEKSNGIEDGKLGPFLKSQRLSKSSMIDQFETDLIWNEFVNGRYGSSVIVNDEEIEDIISTMRSNEGKTEYLLGEIFLAIDNVDQEQQVLKLANRLLQQIHSGARFDSLALNFSQSPSAPVRGDLGWVVSGKLDPAIETAIQLLKPGEVSKIIRGKDGFYFMALRDKRLSKGLQIAPLAPTTVSLYQIHLPLSQDASSSEVQQQIDLANTLRAKSLSCNNMDDLKKQSNSPLSGNLGTMQLSQLSSQLQTLVKDVPAGKTSLPLKTDNGVIFLMVCDRKDANTGNQQNDLSTIEDNIRLRLRAKQLDHFSRQHMRELRRTGFVDIRL